MRRLRLPCTLHSPGLQTTEHSTDELVEMPDACTVCWCTIQLLRPRTATALNPKPCPQVIAIRVDDPLAPLLNDVADIDRCTLILPSKSNASFWQPSASSRVNARPWHIGGIICSNAMSVCRRELPGELERIMTWFRDYKVCFWRLGETIHACARQGAAQQT